MIMNDLVKIHEEAHIKIGTMYGRNIPDNGGSMIVNIGEVNYIY